MITIIITAYKEAKTIGGLIESILDPKFQNVPREEFEILLACPDDETLNAATSKLDEFNFDMNYFIHVKDPKKGKPTALNMAFKKANGSILILTDGDIVKFGLNSINPLIIKLRASQNAGGVTGRPISADRKTDIFGYWGNLLADAANDKRLKTLTNDPSTNKFFVMSGYIMCIYKPEFTIPENVLADDAFISYKIKESGKNIYYEENSLVYIKYPSNLNDWYKQKCRSLGGYIQLHKLGVINVSNKTRSFWGEIEYIKFPISYANSAKEIFWSLLLYPVRLYLWLRVFVERKLFEKSFESTWVRIESTK